MAPASLVSKDKQLSHWTLIDPLMQGPSTQRVQAHVTCILNILLYFMESLVISAVGYCIEHWTIKRAHRCKCLILHILLKCLTNEAEQSHFGLSRNISATGHTKMKLYILDYHDSQRMTPADIGEHVSFPLVQGSHWMPKTETENRAKSEHLLGFTVRMQNVI